MGRVFSIWWPIARWRDFTGFSRTWWGRAILFGIPALIMASELTRLVRHIYARRRAPAAVPNNRE